MDHVQGSLANPQTKIKISLTVAQGWHSGENTRLPPMRPGFKPRCWHKFVVGSLPCCERFLSGYSRFSPLTKNQHFQIPIRPGIRSTKNHFVDVLPPNHYSLFIIIIHTASPIDHSCWQNFKHYAQKNVTVLGSVSGTSLSLNIAISFAVATSTHEIWVKLWELSCFECISCAILLSKL